MKRITIALMFICVVSGLYAQTAEELMQYYNQNSTQTGRLEQLRQLVTGNYPNAGEFYAAALKQLLADYPGIRGNQEVAATDSIAETLCTQLGDLKQASAAPDLGRLVEAFSNPYARGAALVALGKMHDVTNNYYLAQTVQLLTNINNTPPPQSREDAERLATRAITALEYYQNSAGYLPVFFASHSSSWYSDLVRNQASASLAKISDDPSNHLISVIRGASYSVEIKYFALQVLNATASVPADKRSEAAVAAIIEGWRLFSSRQRVQLANLRKLALQMIYQNGASDQAVLAALERSYKEGLDTEERYASANTLASLSARGQLADQSVSLLGSFLIALNQKCSDGSLTRADEAAVRVVIPALGNTRNAGAIRLLNTVQSVSWTNTVKRLARTAVENITRQTSGQPRS